MAPIPGVDASWPLSGAAMRQAGKVWAGRYAGRHPYGMDLTIGEVNDLHAHGIAVLPLYEFSADDLGTKPSAYSAATTALVDAQNLNMPHDRTVGMCLCEDNVSPSPAVQGNAAGGATILRGAGLLAGFYGRKEVARALLAAGQVDFVFVVDTWGADEPGDVWNFRQLPNPPAGGQMPIGGVTCDIDDAPNPVGLWLPAPPAPPPPPPPPITFPPVEIDVNLTKTLVTVQLGGLADSFPGKGWTVCDGQGGRPLINFTDAWCVQANGSDPTGPGGYVPMLPPTMNDRGGFVQIEAYGPTGGAVGVWVVHTAP